MSPFALRRRALLAAGAVLPFAAPAALSPMVARAALPERPVRLVVGFPPGSGPDVLARLVADGLKEALPAGVVVDSKPGAGGLIAAQDVAKASPADGSTLMLGEVGALAMAPSTYARLPYDPARDFAAVAEVASVDFGFVVPEGVPAADLAGYIAWGKTQRQLYMGTFGAGTPGHFACMMLGKSAGLAVEPVHFRSTGDAMTAILGGNIQGMFGSLAVVLPHVRAGKLKALAVTGPVRASVLPQVPTMAELGQPALGISAWFGLVAPAGTPPAVLQAVEAETLKALASPALASRITEAGFRVSAQGRAGFARLMREDTARWAEMVRDTGFRAIE